MLKIHAILLEMKAAVTNSIFFSFFLENKHRQTDK